MHSDLASGDKANIAKVFLSLCEPNVQGSAAGERAYSLTLRSIPLALIVSEGFRAE
jgi:hypothetical protein